MDLFHGISASPRPKCEKCGGSCRRLLGSGAGIIFKGSGFYETDYKTKKGKPPESSDEKTPGKDGGTAKTDSSKKDGTSTKSDSRSASKE